MPNTIKLHVIYGRFLQKHLEILTATRYFIFVEEGKRKFLIKLRIKKSLFAITDNVKKKALKFLILRACEVGDVLKYDVAILKLWQKIIAKIMTLQYTYKICNIYNLSNLYKRYEDNYVYSRNH